MKEYTCSNCGKVYTPKYIPRTEVTFCSHSCSAIFNNPIRGRKRRTKKCLNCPRSIESGKFCSLKCSAEHRSKTLVAKWLETGVSPNVGKVPRYISSYLIESQARRCAICGIENIWNGKPLLLIADHIDGNSNNNERANLRAVCSNCDSQLPTYKGRNKGSGRHYRRTRYSNGQSY